jgi:hypothetical protein
MLKKIMSLVLAGALIFGGFLAVKPQEKAYAWDEGTSYKSLSGGSTLYTGTAYPSASGSSTDLTFQASWTDYRSLTFQLQYYGPYGYGWLNSGSSWSSSTGNTYKTFTGLTGNYQYRVKITNNSTGSTTFSVLWLK